MKLTQNWVGYLDRSYEQVKKSVLKRLTINTPEITDFGESNPFIILVSMFSGIAEMLNLYIDNMARELFIGTARRYKSLIKIAGLLDYRVKASIPSNLDLIFNLIDSTTEEPLINTTGSDIIIPLGTIITSGSNEFVLQDDAIIRVGQTSAAGGGIQYQQIEWQTMGISSGNPFIIFPLPPNYAHNTLEILVGLEAYTEEESFYFMLADTKAFIVNALEDGNMYVIFGDGYTGAIPPSGETISYRYKATNGVDGNILPNTTEFDATAITGIPSGATITVVNKGYGINGSDIEGITDIRMRAPLVYSTKRRAVTRADYRDIALLAPGVGKAKVVFCCCQDCAAFIKVYIGPNTKGIATSVLLDSTEAYFSDKKIVGRKVEFYPAGISRIFIRAIINANPGFTELQVRSDVYQALNISYGYIASDINLKIQPSDIIFQLERLRVVDSVSLDAIYLEPYARPLSDGMQQLSIVYGPITYSGPNPIKIRVRFNDDGLGGTGYTIYKNGTVVEPSLAEGGTYTVLNTDSSPILAITVSNPDLLYTDGDTWEFVIYPSYPQLFSNYQLQVNDNSIPIVDVNYDILLPNGLPTVFGDFTINLPGSGESDCNDC